LTARKIFYSVFEGEIEVFESRKLIDLLVKIGINVFWEGNDYSRFDFLLLSLRNEKVQK